MGDWMKAGQMLSARGVGPVLPLRPMPATSKKRQRDGGLRTWPFIQNSFWKTGSSRKNPQGVPSVPSLRLLPRLMSESSAASLKQSSEPPHSSSSTPLGISAVMGVLVMHLITTALSIGTNLWLAVWTADAQPAVVVATTLDGSNSTIGETYQNLPFLVYVIGYAVIGIVLAVVTWIRTVGAAFFSLRASRRLHDALVARVMRAPLTFFDTTPIGRIVSRFSKDMYSIDNGRSPPHCTPCPVQALLAETR